MFDPIDTQQIKLPHPAIAATPIVALIGLLAMVISLFGSDALGGGSQIALMTASAVCIGISACLYKTPWKIFEQQIGKTIGDIGSTIILLFVIGMLSASWMISGVVPTIIYYGIQMMSPHIFLVCTCLFCALVSLLSGSSWTTIATVGVAMIGIGNALGIPAAWTAGAIISGAYFGDKLSPLSDTTILASSVAGTELFTHIRYMMFTTIPSIIIALIVFLIAGFSYGQNQAIQVEEYTVGLSSTFNISIYTLIVPLLTGIMIARKVPSLITLFISSLLGGAVAIILQPHILEEITGTVGDLGYTLRIVKGLFITYFGSTAIETGNESLNDLVATSGMAGMLNTVWLILCAMCFGSVLVASRMIESLTMQMLRIIKGRVSLVFSTLCSGLFLNTATGDQYISILLTANMFRDAYQREGYEPRFLSRTTEDVATVTSVLIPWNTCGMTQATVLGVPTLTFLPYCVFNYISPLMSLAVAALGWKIYQNRSKDKK